MYNQSISRADIVILDPNNATSFLYTAIGLKSQNDDSTCKHLCNDANNAGVADKLGERKEEGRDGGRALWFTWWFDASVLYDFCNPKA